jgi:hypothetical protein
VKILLLHSAKSSFPTTSQTERQAKGQPKANVEEASNKPKKTYDKMSISLAGAFADPRAARVQRILQSNVMELQSEKFKQFQIAPTTAYDLYMNNIRSANSNIKQASVPTDAEKRHMESNTDDIVMHDKSVQFTFTDDTALLATMDALSRKKRDAQRQKRGESKHLDEDEQSTNATSHSVSIGTSTSDFTADTTDVFASVAGTKLSAFLRRSANIFDALLKDEGEGKSSEGSNQSSGADSKWVSLGAGAGKESSVIGRRKTVMVRFSEVQSNLMVSAHPYPTGSNAEGDQYPYKVCACACCSR